MRRLPRDRLSIAPSASPTGWCITAIGGPTPNPSTGDSYDNALAETVIGLFKTEEIYAAAPGRGLEDIEFATLEWVAWHNRGRLLEPLGYVPPPEFEQAYQDRQAAPAGMAVLT